MTEFDREVAARVGRSRRRLDMLSTLATGFLPWGTPWEPFLSLCGGEYILSCGLVMKRAEARLFIEKGLLAPGAPDNFDRQTLVITEAGRLWLKMNWWSRREKGR